MRSGLLLSALAGLALAAPAPQAFDMDAVDDLPEPTLVGPDITALSETVAATAAATAVVASLVAEITAVNTPSKVKRDGNCAVQPAGAGPTGTTDSASYFSSDSQYPNIANAASTPSGYSKVFGPLTGSLQQAGFLALHTLNSYDPSICSGLCDGVTGCQAFDIYFERDPTLDPNADSCPNPPSTINIKCTLYGFPIDARTAVNTGQPRDDFIVVIAGSNGYQKAGYAPAVANFTGPVSFGNNAINAPSGYITFKTFMAPSYDPTACAALCQAQTAYNHNHPAKGSTTYNACNFFNSYVLSKNGVVQGVYCSFYTQQWGAQYATNSGQTRGSDVYTVSDSYGYTLTTQDSGQL